MKETLSQFSFQDFVGYLFPGLTYATGIYLLYLGIEWPVLSVPPVSWQLFAAIVGAGYTLGVVLSATDASMRGHGKWKMLPDKVGGPVGMGRALLCAGLKQTLGDEPMTNVDLFYLARSMAIATSPAAGPMILRQMAIRQFRRNVRPACYALSAGLALFAGRTMFEVRRVSLWWLFVFSVALIISCVIPRILKRAEQRNGDREEREVYAALLAQHLVR